MNLKHKIESVMRSEKNSRTDFFGSFLFAVSLLYGSIVRTREFFYQKKIFKSRKLPCKVISVGNLTVGGTGKTPMTIHIARQLSSQGYNTAVISRGYGGCSEKTAAIVSDGQQIFLQSDEAGDEPFMMARNLTLVPKPLVPKLGLGNKRTFPSWGLGTRGSRGLGTRGSRGLGTRGSRGLGTRGSRGLGTRGNIPVIVGQNRFKAGWLAIDKFAPDVIVLDDAFQHLKLVRDIDLVLLDYHRPFGNNHLLPRGTLREPLSALARADAFILTRCDAVPGEDQAALKKIIGNRPVFKTVHSPYISELILNKAGFKPLSKAGFKPALQGQSSIAGFKPALQGRNGFVFSGIAGNRDFRSTVETLGCRIAGFSEFADHHRYSAADIEAISDSAYKAKADILVTTEKDYVRISPETRWTLDLAVVGAEISFGADNHSFGQFIEKMISEE